MPGYGQRSRVRLRTLGLWRWVRFHLFADLGMTKHRIDSMSQLVDESARGKAMEKILRSPEAVE